MLGDSSLIGGAIFDGGDTAALVIGALLVVAAVVAIPFLFVGEFLRKRKLDRQAAEVQQGTSGLESSERIVT